MQKLEFLVWNGAQFVLVEHEWELDSVSVNRATVQIFMKPKPKPEVKK